MNDRSRPDESGSEKTIAAVNNILPNAADSASLAIPVITDDMSQPDIAIAIAAAGMYVFPVDHPELPLCAGVGKTHDPSSPNHDRGKHPCVVWSEKATNKEKVIYAHWSGGPRNIGIHCGKSKLVVVDEDRLGEFKRYADERGVKIPPTLVVRTAKGRHYYFAAREDHSLGNKEGAFGDYSINIRGDGGYVVGPGSVHATGVVYRIEVELPPDPIPDWVIAAIQAKTNGHKTTNVDGIVFEDIGGFDRFELPEVIKDHHRHTALVQYASSMRAREIPLAEARVLMIYEALPRCEQPPMARWPVTEDEAIAKLEDIYERYGAGRSEGYEKQGADGEGDGGGRATFDSLVAKEAAKIRIREAARDLVDASRRPPVAVYDAGTLGEILARPPEPKARIEGLIPWEAGTLIVGQRKVGKTTFNGKLCRSLINGGTFLGCFPVRPVDGNVALLNYEMPAQTLARWYDGMRIPHSRLHMMNLRGRSNPLASEEERTRLAEWLLARDIESIVYDPFGRAYAGKSQNDPGEVGAWLAELDRFTRGEAGIKDLILPAHAGWDGERTRGASALEDWADSIITLTNDNGDRYIRAVGRDVYLEEDQLRFHRDERYLDLARTGSRKATAEKRTTDALRTAILKIVAEQPKINGTEVEQALRDAGVTFQRGDHRPVLKALVDERKLTFEPGAHNAKCYSLRAENAPDSPDSPQIAHGLADSVSPVRPYRDGLTEHNTGPSDEDPEVGLTGSPLVDPEAKGHPVFADGAVQLDLLSEETGTPRKRPKAGICAGCGERMTITEDGQTAHPGCEVTQ